MVLLTGIISGVSIFVNSFGVKEFDSSIFAFLKNITVAIFLLAFIALLGNINALKGLKIKHWIQLVFIGFIGGSIPFLLFFRGLQITNGITASFIHKTLFVYATIFSLIFLKEKITKNIIVGAILILVGTYLMIRPGLILSSGNLLIFLAAILWAAENVFAKYSLREIPGNIVGFGRMFFGSLFILAFLLFTSKFSLISKITMEQMLWIGLTSIFLFAYVTTFYNGLKRVKVTTATCILSIGLPITAILSWVFQGKPFSLYQGIGIILILLGIISITLFAEIFYFISTMVKVNQHGRA